MILLLLSGCWPELPPCPSCRENTDRDGDRFAPADGDCDDDDPDVNPGAPETCNGIDDDCDGMIDVGALEAEPRWTDRDGDGFGTGDPVSACPDAADTASVGGDCDDTAADTNPGAEERCNDGIDNDCDGTAAGCARRGRIGLEQADGLVVSRTFQAGVGRWLAAGPDGVLTSGLLPNLAYRFASRSDWPDVVVAEDSRSATVLATTIAGSFAAYGAGWLVRDDALLDGQGQVHALPGELTGEIDAASFRVATRTGLPLEAIGRRLATTSEGAFVTSEDPSTIGWWLPHPLEGVGDIDDDGIRFDGALAPATIALGDLSGDGHADLAMGDPGLLFATGEVRVFFGPLGDGPSALRPSAVLRGDNGHRRVGGGLAILPDLSGDGIGELAIAGPDDGDNDEVWILEGPPPLDAEVAASAWLRLRGPAGAELGRAIAAVDIDLDGALDIAVTAPTEGTNVGAVYVVHGPFAGGVRQLDDDELVLVGKGAGYLTGATLAVTDADRDGFDDLIVGAPGESTLADNGGGFYVWLSRGR